MFFSVDILTNKTSGFSTAWLMATLGAKQIGGKINKQTILGTPVPKVCEMIEEPPTGPLALRLSSQLLYGIALIYGQQIKYLLADAAGVKTQIMSFEENERKRQFFSATAAVDLVAVTGKRKRKPEIELQNDPAFSLDFFILPGPSNSVVVRENGNEVRNNRWPLHGRVANTSLQAGVDDITLLNESIEQAAVNPRDFLGSFMYEDERGGDELDSVVLGFNFGADGELIHEEGEENMSPQKQKPGVSTDKNLKSNTDEDGSAGFDFELPETNDDMAIYNGPQLLYEPGTNSMGLDELRAAALNGQLDSEGFPRSVVDNDDANNAAGVETLSKHKSKRRRLCEFDTNIYLSIDLLRDFRDNYCENMLATAARRRQTLMASNMKKRQTLSFSEFARVAVGGPVNSVPALSQLFMSHGYNMENNARGGRHWNRTPPPVELGRAGSQPGSVGGNHSVYSASPSIPLSGSSPLVRGGSSSRLFPALPTSDLGLILEHPQDIGTNVYNELHQNLLLSSPGRHNDYRQPLYAGGADIEPAFDDFFPMENNFVPSNHVDDLGIGTTNYNRNTENEATALFFKQLAPQARTDVKSFARMYPKMTNLEQRQNGARRIAAAAGFSQLLKMISSGRAILVNTEKNDILFKIIATR